MLHLEVQIDRQWHPLAVYIPDLLDDACRACDRAVNCYKCHCRVRDDEVVELVDLALSYGPSIVYEKMYVRELDPEYDPRYDNDWEYYDGQDEGAQIRWQEVGF